MSSCGGDARAPVALRLKPRCTARGYSVGTVDVTGPFLKLPLSMLLPYETIWPRLPADRPKLLPVTTELLSETTELCPVEATPAQLFDSVDRSIAREWRSAVLPLTNATPF